MDLSLTLRETLEASLSVVNWTEHVSYLLKRNKPWAQRLETTPEWLRIERINKRIVRDTHLDGVLGCGKFSDFPTETGWELEVVYRREFEETVLLSANLTSADHSKLTLAANESHPEYEQVRTALTQFGDMVIRANAVDTNYSTPVAKVESILAALACGVDSTAYVEALDAVEDSSIKDCEDIMVNMYPEPWIKFLITEMSPLQMLHMRMDLEAKTVAKLIA